MMGMNHATTCTHEHYDEYGRPTYAHMRYTEHGLHYFNHEEGGGPEEVGPFEKYGIDPVEGRLLWAAQELREAEQRMAREARAARAAGWSWDRIGAAYGITRQTAATRYAERD